MNDNEKKHMCIKVSSEHNLEDRQDVYSSDFFLLDEKRETAFNVALPARRFVCSSPCPVCPSGLNLDGPQIPRKEPVPCPTP